MDSLNVFVKNGTNTDALHVKVIEMLNDVPTEGEQITSDTSVLYSSRDVNAPIAITEMPTKKKKKRRSRFEEFISSIQISPLGFDNDYANEPDVVVTQPDSRMDCRKVSIYGIECFED